MTEVIDRFRPGLLRFAPALLILAFQLLVFPMPGGVFVRGLTVGLLGALVAIGMALIYRANAIINFAQADLGSVPVVLVVNLIVFSGMSYWLAFPVGLVAAALVGALVELVDHPAVLRRLPADPHRGDDRCGDPAGRLRPAAARVCGANGPRASRSTSPGTST